MTTLKSVVCLSKVTMVVPRASLTPSFKPSLQHYLKNWGRPYRTYPRISSDVSRICNYSRRFLLCAKAFVSYALNNGLG